jgi:hypothetical protein
MEQDPGIQGAKLSKSGDNGLEDRNKSYEKVLDAEIAWIRAEQAGLSDAEELRIKWHKKAEWHERTYGW